LLDRPWLWRINRRTVALGAALGVFFGFLIPIAQIFFSAIFALLLRANLPVAAIATLVSNPFTYGPIFLLAYRTGALLLGEVPDPSQEAAIDIDVEVPGDVQSWAERFSAIGKPLMLGLVVFAVTGGVVTWVAVNLIWLLVVRLRRRRARPPGTQG
jgi:uncharacterized protein